MRIPRKEKKKIRTLQLLVTGYRQIKKRKYSKKDWVRLINSLAWMETQPITIHDRKRANQIR